MWYTREVECNLSSILKATRDKHVRSLHGREISHFICVNDTCIYEFILVAILLLKYFYLLNSTSLNYSIDYSWYDCLINSTNFAIEINLFNHFFNNHPHPNTTIETKKRDMITIIWTQYLNIHQSTNYII